MALPSSLSDLEVRVEFLLENPPCKEGQAPDILLKSALRAEKRPKIRVFSSGSGVPAACLKGRVHFFDDFFEIATDPPGFTSDESAAELGASLRLPPSMESARAHIEELLPPITLPVKAAP
jgi:hypothetical protein